MNEEAPAPAKRIRLTGRRFDGGRLPIDSLVELQRYQQAVRAMAEHEWSRDHPGEALPESFRDSVSLTIAEVRDGSADLFLVFEQVAVYQEYQAQARDAVDATIQAAYGGTDLPALPDEVRDEVRYTLAQIGNTLSEGQAIELYVVDGGGSPVEINVNTRQEAVDRLVLEDFFIDTVTTVADHDLATRDEIVVAHVTAIDADKMTYEIRDPESRTIGGWYKDNPDILTDLRAVVNSASDGPLTRISGALQYRLGEPWRFKKTYRVERVEFEQTSWGDLLTKFAALKSGWASGHGHAVSSVALEAARSVMKQLNSEVADPSMAPTEDGGVLLEWIAPSGIRSVEVLEDGTFELFAMRPDERRGHQAVTANSREAAAFVSDDSA